MVIILDKTFYIIAIYIFPELPYIIFGSKLNYLVAKEWADMFIIIFYAYSVGGDFKNYYYVFGNSGYKAEIREN